MGSETNRWLQMTSALIMDKLNECKVEICTVIIYELHF